MPGGAVQELSVSSVAAPARAVLVVPAGEHELRVSRRRMLLIGFWTALGAMLVSGTVTVLNALYPRGAPKLSGKHVVGTLDALPPGAKQPVVVQVADPRDPLKALDAKVFLVRVDKEQAARNPGAQEGMVYAFWRKCPHLGCTVPWNPTFSFQDPRSGETSKGWFRCPCHGSTYSDAGVKVFGPAPRSLDMFPLTINSDGKLIVDVGRVITGSDQDPARGVLPA
jgi:cytochrome b6-f complex iron-sulfur subunit